MGYCRRTAGRADVVGRSSLGFWYNRCSALHLNFYRMFELKERIDVFVSRFGFVLRSLDVVEQTLILSAR